MSTGLKLPATVTSVRLLGVSARPPRRAHSRRPSRTHTSVVPLRSGPPAFCGCHQVLPAAQVVGRTDRVDCSLIGNAGVAEAQGVNADAIELPDGLASSASESGTILAATPSMFRSSVKLDFTGGLRVQLIERRRRSTRAERETTQGCARSWSCAVRSSECELLRESAAGHAA